MYFQTRVPLMALLNSLICFLFQLYILFRVCRFIWLRLLADKTAEETSKKVKELFMELGLAPCEMQSDNGVEFTDAVFM